MEPLTGILSFAAIANIVVLTILVWIFVLSYTRTKAQFPLAMSVFCGFLILHNLISAQAYFVTVHIFSEQIFPYLIGIHITELAGLLVFLKISYQ